MALVQAPRLIRRHSGAIAIAILVGVCAQLRITGQAQRIVSIIPATTEMLFAMGAGDRLVAVGSYDRFPPEIERLPRVGALLDPDIERIITLRPDLVVLYGTQTDLRTQLDRAGIPYYSYVHRGLSDIAGTIRSLGARVGVARQALRIIAFVFQEKMDRSREARPETPRELVEQVRPRIILDGVDGVEAQPVEMKLLKPIFGVLDEEIADRA